MKTISILILMLFCLLGVSCAPGEAVELPAGDDATISLNEVSADAEETADEGNEGALKPAPAVSPVEKDAKLTSAGDTPSSEQQQAEIDAANRPTGPLSEGNATIEGPEPGTETGATASEGGLQSGGSTHISDGDAELQSGGSTAVIVEAPGQTGGDTGPQTGKVTIVTVLAPAADAGGLGSIEIKNESDQPIQLLGWVLRDEVGTILFEFPEYAIQAKETCRLYPGDATANNDQNTNEDCIFYFNPGASPVWEENQGCILLSDPTRIVESYCLPSG